MQVPVGSVWDTHAGNHWEVVAVLPNDRVRVRCVYQTSRCAAPLGETFVWHVSSLVNGTRIDREPGDELFGADEPEGDDHGDLLAIEFGTDSNGYGR